MHKFTKSELYSRAHAAIHTRLRTFAGGRLAAYCRPVSIAILLTERCNARCLHCDIWKNRGKEETPTLDQWKTVFRDLRRWLGPVQVTCTGGEALLRPDTTDLVAYASGLGLLVEVLTHGYWHDQTRIEKLARANPWRITISCDGIGATHDKVRGREHFFDTMLTSLATIERVGREMGRRIPIRLKTVIMEHNLHDVANVARFAQERGYEVFYQPIEQNYNSTEDLHWHEHTSNWPSDTARAVAVVRELMEMKHQGFPIANNDELLAMMIPYFENPESLRVLVQNHSLRERPACTALTNLQIQSNGDVTPCFSMPTVGNIRQTPIRQIWANRPAWWRGGCCMERRMSAAERALVVLPAESAGSV